MNTRPGFGYHVPGEGWVRVDVVPETEAIVIDKLRAIMKVRGEMETRDRLVRYLRDTYRTPYATLMQVTGLSRARLAKIVATTPRQGE